MTKPILPGSTIGVLGSGQLGRMFAIAARRLGYRVHVLSPETDTPTGQVADLEVKAEYADLDAVADFVRDVDVVTFEFENVPSATAEVAALYAPVRPDGSVLHITQHRIREKSFLRERGFPTASFAVVNSLTELKTQLGLIGLPAVLKTAGWGYDGKGQSLIGEKAQAEAAWQSLNTNEAVLEGFVDFQRELSVIVARSGDGETVTYGPIENRHQHHILDVSFTPANISTKIAREGIELATNVALELDLVGVLCVELFMTVDDRLLINELAPRPHNSGHLTIDAHVTCQFEQQVRAVCGLPLGSARQHCPAAMANLLGDIWQTQRPDWKSVAAMREVKLHLYGKHEPRPGRKMGHLTALADSVDQAIELVRSARAMLAGEVAMRET